MARFRSQVYTEIRGSVGGLTYTATPPHSLVVRGRTSPVQPNTTPQAGIRSCFTGAIGAWGQLSAANRQVWDMYAETVQYSGPLGQYQLTGRQIMIAGYSLAAWGLLKDAGVTGVSSDPPISPGKVQLESLALASPSVPGTGFAIEGIVQDVDSVVVIAEASRHFNDTRQRFKGPFRPETITGLLVAGPAGFTFDILGLQEGYTYFIRVRAVVDQEAHRISNDFILRGTAATNPGP